MRKVLEAALREGDVGLVETQKLGRDVLGELRSPASAPATVPAVTSPRLATATATGSLADELEPDTGPTPRASRRGMWVGARAAGRRRRHGRRRARAPGSATSHAAVAGITGVTATGRGVFDGLSVETDGSVTPERVAAAYRATLVELAGREPRRTRSASPIPCTRFVAIPRAALCEPTRLSRRAVPADCGTAHRLGGDRDLRGARTGCW